MAVPCSGACCGIDLVQSSCDSVVVLQGQAIVDLYTTDCTVGVCAARWQAPCMILSCKQYLVLVLVWHNHHPIVYTFLSIVTPSILWFQHCQKPPSISLHGKTFWTPDSLCHQIHLVLFLKSIRLLPGHCRIKRAFRRRRGWFAPCCLFPTSWQWRREWSSILSFFLIHNITPRLSRDIVLAPQRSESLDGVVYRLLHLVATNYLYLAVYIWQVAFFILPRNKSRNRDRKKERKEGRKKGRKKRRIGESGCKGKGMNDKNRMEEGVTVPEMFDKSMMSVRDAWSQYYFNKSLDNERPYTVEAVKYNNSLVIEWKDQLLLQLADSKLEVMAELVPISLKVFLDRIDIQGLHELYNLDQEFELPAAFTKIEEMNMKDVLSFISPSAAVFIRQDIIKSMALALAKEKWDLVFKDCGDAIDCYKRASKYKHLFDGQQYRFAFGLTEDRFKNVMEKLGTIINTPIKVWQ